MSRTRRRRLARNRRQARALVHRGRRLWTAALPLLSEAMRKALPAPSRELLLECGRTGGVDSARRLLEHWSIPGRLRAFFTAVGVGEELTLRPYQREGAQFLDTLASSKALNQGDSSPPGWKEQWGPGSREQAAGRIPGAPQPVELRLGSTSAEVPLPSAVISNTDAPKAPRKTHPARSASRGKSPRG